MRKFKADILYPISSPPIKNGIVIAGNNGKITALLSPEHAEYAGALDGAENLNGLICPCFVNTHCHLELSYLHKKIAEHKGLNGFILELQKTRNNFTEAEIIASISDAENEMYRNGIIAVGDICNGLSTIPIKQNKKLFYHSFVELFGFDAMRAGAIFTAGEQLFSRFLKAGLRTSITPHAPYSTSLKLIQLIAAHSTQHAKPLSIHNQESEEENKLFNNKSGKMAALLEQFGFDLSNWECSGKNSLPSYSSAIQTKTNTLFVHNTFTSSADIKAIISPTIYWCLCPNANLYIENCLPNIPELIKAKAQITLGTDSLASNNQLSIWEEIKTIKNNFPEIKTETLLKWGTLNGAIYLGIQNQFGSLEIGKSPGLNWIEEPDSNNSKVKRIL